MQQQYDIRPIDTYNLQDSCALKLVWDVFCEFEAHEYSKRGIQEFQKYIAKENIMNMMRHDRLFMWGCFFTGETRGVIAVRPPCHISLLFVKKQYHRQGIAHALFRTALDFCQENFSCTQATVHASPYSVGAYRALGFAPTSEERTEHGMRFTPMVCSLEPSMPPG